MVYASGKICFAEAKSLHIHPVLHSRASEYERKLGILRILASFNMPLSVPRMYFVVITVRATMPVEED